MSLVWTSHSFRVTKNNFSFIFIKFYLFSFQVGKTVLLDRLDIQRIFLKLIRVTLLQWSFKVQSVTESNDPYFYIH